jgi:tetratricopeptide (TPR) repeat protein
MTQTITQLSPALRGLRTIRIVSLASFCLFTMMSCTPTDPVQDVRNQIAAGEVRAALEPLRRLIKESPDAMELLFLYGQALIKTGQPGLAEWPLRKARTDPEWFVPASMLIANVEQAGGNAENAAATYADILALHPDNMDVRIKRANVMARSPRLLHEALAEVDRILEIDPMQLSAFKPRILAYLGLNQPEDAARVLEELGERIEAEQPEEDPIRGWHCATMAIFADDSGEEELARERWSACTERYPTHPNVVGKAVEFYREKQELETALKVARVAFEVETAEGSGYRLVMAGLLQALDRSEEAEALLIEGAELADRSITRSAILLALAEHYKTVGNLAAAADTLERALAVAQEFAGAQPDLLFALADLRIQLGQLDHALVLASKMTVAAHRALVRGAVAHDQKEYAKAVRLYDEATRLWPENPFAPFYGAKAALALGQIDRAFEGFLLSIRVNENATDARLHAAQILLAEGRFSTALEILATTRMTPSIVSTLLGLEVTAQSRGSQAALKFADRFSQQHPDQFGQAIAIAAESVGMRGDGQEAWSVVQPFLALGFPAHNHLPILLAAADWARNEEQMAIVESLVGPAAEANPDSAIAKLIEGVVFERSGKSHEAEERYRAALEIETNAPSTLFRIAGVLAPRDPSGAIELLSLGLEEPAGLESAMQARVFLAAATQLLDSRGIETILESALERMPTNGSIAYRLASVMEARVAEPAPILRMLRRAIRFQAGPQAVELYASLAAKR